MRKLLAAIFCFSAIFGYGQFKADNVKYKTVFPQDLCQTLQSNPGYVLLDVRSDGEFNDTMNTAPSLNIGHLQNALHINITQLPQRWKELSDYRDRPLFIYCSHSQRSRRAARILADSGFTRVFNINGGLTDFYEQGIEGQPCAAYTIVRSQPYQILSARELANSRTNYFIVDLRSDSAFNGQTSDERIKMQGRLQKAVNIPFEKFRTQDVAFPDLPILLIDDDGNQSPLIARMLWDRGIKNVSVLFDGMEAWLKYRTSAGKTPVKWKSYSSFSMLSPDEFSRWMSKGKALQVIDIRPKDQFMNQSKNYWQNIGHIKNAINIPYAESSTVPGDGPVVVYGFNNENEVFNAARRLKNQGRKNVYVLRGGIWNLRWAAHNLKGETDLGSWVVDVPPENE